MGTILKFGIIKNSYEEINKNSIDGKFWKLGISKLFLAGATTENA